MNFMQIALTTRCNFSCAYCPMAQWRNTEPKYPLNVDELVRFLETFVDANDWIIELTGGEPGCFPGIDQLCSWLSEHKYRTLIKTNGSMPLKPYLGITRVAAFHNLDNPPKYFDKYLIINTDGREEKEEYCKRHGIDYRVIGFNREHIDEMRHGFERTAFINPAGHQIGCQSERAIERGEGTDDWNRINHRALRTRPACPSCKILNDAWRFL